MTEQERFDKILKNCADEIVSQQVRALAVEPLQTSETQIDKYAQALYARVMELDATRRIAELKRELQRINPLDDQATYDDLFADLVALEQHRRTLREQAMGVQ